MFTLVINQIRSRPCVWAAHGGCCSIDLFEYLSTGGHRAGLNLGLARSIPGHNAWRRWCHFFTIARWTTRLLGRWGRLKNVDNIIYYKQHIHSAPSLKLHIHKFNLTIFNRQISHIKYSRKISHSQLTLQTTWSLFNVADNKQS